MLRKQVYATRELKDTEGNVYKANDCLGTLESYCPGKPEGILRTKENGKRHTFLLKDFSFFQKRASDLHEIIYKLASSYSLEVTFAEGKRKGDVTILHLSGNTTWLQAFYAKLIAGLPEFELEIFNIPESEKFGLIAAIVTPERDTESPYQVKRTHLSVECLKLKEQ